MDQLAGHQDLSPLGGPMMEAGNEIKTAFIAVTDITDSVLEFTDEMNSRIRDADHPDIVGDALKNTYFAARIYGDILALLTAVSDNDMAYAAALTVFAPCTPEIRSRLEETVQESMNAVARLGAPEGVYDHMRQQAQDYYNQEAKRYDHPPG